MCTLIQFYLVLFLLCVGKETQIYLFKTDCDACSETGFDAAEDASSQLTLNMCFQTFFFGAFYINMLTSINFKY